MEQSNADLWFFRFHPADLVARVDQRVSLLPDASEPASFARASLWLSTTEALLVQMLTWSWRNDASVSSSSSTSSATSSSRLRIPKWLEIESKWTRSCVSLLGPTRF